MNVESWIALFLLLTAVAYLIYGILYAQRTFDIEREFFFVSVWYVIGAFFFVIYGIINYYHVVFGKGSEHTSYLNYMTQN